MKRSFFCCLNVIILIHVTLMCVYALNSEINSRPIADVKEGLYDFDSVIEGININHEFFIWNRGSADLIIESVKVGCGCVTSDYTKKIAPGEKGIVSLIVRTKGYGNRKIRKKATVKTNDPQNAQISLTITGEVKTFAQISPNNVRLSGNFQDSISQTVTIVPSSLQPFKIVKVRTKNGEYINCSLSAKESSDASTTYYLKVDNTKKEKGRYYDNVYLDTDNKTNPYIKISVSGNIN